MTTHELKCWPEFFCHILSGEKTFEVRKDDRGFRAGDELRLREWVNDGTGYTGREVTVRVTYLLAGKPWLEKDYVVMGFQPHKSWDCPEGWKLVPIEPTTGMLMAGKLGDTVKERYQAQLAAAPNPSHKPGPSPTADEDGRCTRCGCRFEDPRELTHECPPGFQLPSEDRKWTLAR